jgi:hypothetical protein
VSGSWLFLAPVVALSCSKQHGDTQLQATSSSVDARETSAPAAALASTTGSTSAHATGWHGTYKSTAGEVYVPPDWKNVHWTVKESPAGIGEGAIALSVDAATGRTVGTLEGPLGPATIDGFVANGKLTATIARKDPTDQGFTGTLVGVLAEHCEGTMNLSPAEANAVRTVTFALAPDVALAPSR